MYDNLLLSPVPLDRLLHLFREVIRQEIKAEHDEQLQDKLLTTAELCKIFNVTGVTINSWIKKSLLIKHSKGGRNYFKYSEVMESMKTLKRYKTK